MHLILNVNYKVIVYTVAHCYFLITKNEVLIASDHINYSDVGSLYSYLLPARLMNTWSHLMYLIYLNMQILILLFLILFILISFSFHLFHFILNLFSFDILYQRILAFADLHILQVFFPCLTLLFIVSFLNPSAFILVQIDIFIIPLLILLVHQFLYLVRFLNYLFNLLGIILYVPFALPNFSLKKFLGNFIVIINNWSQKICYDCVFFQNYLKSLILHLLL